MDEIEKKTDTIQHETIRKTTEALLRLMGFSDVSVSLRQHGPDEPLVIAVSTSEAGMLIGEHGLNLKALEYIVKLVVRKILSETPRYILDINNYREERIAELKNYVRDVANKVSREGREFVMEPMSSYERRVVHAELTSRPDITTESTGEGVERRVVVKPLS